MQLSISKKAAILYKKEMDLQKGDSLRLYVRIGGVGSGGFSVGVMKDKPNQFSYTVEQEGIIFFVEEDDFWYFNGMDIDYSEDLDYIHFEHATLEHLEHPEHR
ncbi:HesB/YadR/YfhF family protein [Bacillus sp. JCM 19034]|uniref:HesB/YadR/YfhF family protein n=1 Tax=Bacillus sp. JCM 19034 TaxID=1481928 RepID=UPI000782DDAD|nr:iron-sulfur cluster biosynthesis family protein [Bacillus sp. JCM 19034]